MKKLLKLDGVKALSKMEQKSVFGGETEFAEDGWCSGCGTGDYCLPSGCACLHDNDCMMGDCQGSIYSHFGVCA